MISTRIRFCKDEVMPGSETVVARISAAGSETVAWMAHGQPHDEQFNLTRIWRTLLFPPSHRCGCQAVDAAANRE